MGSEPCDESKDISPEAKYYFKNIENDMGFPKEDQDMQEECKLELKITDISSGKCKINLIQYTDNTRKIKLKDEEETEMASVSSSSNSIIFNKFFILNYYFEKEQPIDFNISGSINSTISTSLHSIMGSRGQKFIKVIKEGKKPKLEIQGFSYKNKQRSTFLIKVEINGNFKIKGINYFLKFLGSNNNKKNSILYKSEILNPRILTKMNFETCKIPDLYLAPDLNLDSNNIEISFINSYQNKLLGKYSAPISTILNSIYTVNLGPEQNAKIYSELLNNYSFLDYIRGGTQINLIIGIDFTASNGDKTKPYSLHYTGTSNNYYELAIHSCGDIVAYYDYDQLFPCFGFGGKFCNNTKVSHCYPLNMNFEDANIHTVEGVLQEYRNILEFTKLSGPTYFHFIIDKVISIVKEDVINGNKKKYSILMILTDGIIDDIDETIDSLVEASFLPISVIIVGIGNADFTNMNVLDSDDIKLKDKNGRKADRDLVQFVEFKKFCYNGELLAQKILEEIPRQFCEYYQHQKIPPGEAIFNI